MATTQSNGAGLHLSTLKTIRTDAGSGFTSKEFQDMCNERGIKFSFAAPRHQEMNGLAERSWRSIRDLAFAMMNHAHVGDEFFDFALDHAWKVYNCLPVRGLSHHGQPATPFEMFYGVKPSLKRFRVLFCPCIMAIGDKNVDRVRSRKNTPERGMRGIHVGIANRTAGWLVYVPSLNRTYVSADVRFDEKFQSTFALQSEQSRFSGGVPLQPHPQEITDHDQIDVVGFNLPSDQGGESDSEYEDEISLEYDEEANDYIPPQNSPVFMDVETPNSPIKPSPNL